MAVQIPSQYIHLIPEVLEWHTNTYTGSSFVKSGEFVAFDEYECHARLERILDRWYKEHRVVEQGVKPFEIENNELYFLQIAMSDAADNLNVISLVNIHEEALLSFLEWLKKE